jgi:hypothetical protein
MSKVMSWLWRLVDRWEERRAAKRYMKMIDKASKNFLKSDAYRRIVECKHENQSPNLDATAVNYGRSTVCNDCGIGIIYISPRK